jgi:hypothetical protein
MYAFFVITAAASIDARMMLRARDHRMLVGLAATGCPLCSMVVQALPGAGVLVAWLATCRWLILLSHGVVAATCRSYNEWKRDKEGTSSATAGSSGSSTAAGDAARGLGQEAKDTAQSAKEVVKMEGQAAGRDKFPTLTQPSVKQEGMACARGSFGH